MIIGTPHYMAPEAGEGQHGRRTRRRVFTGRRRYRMITGELPYTGDSVHTILYKHIFEEVPSAAAKRSDAPPFLAAAISRALSKEPDQRVRHDGGVRDRGVAGTAGPPRRGSPGAPQRLRAGRRTAQGQRRCAGPK